MPKIVKKLRIHQSYSLNPHFYIRSIHLPPKNTPKHHSYTLYTREAFFPLIFSFRTVICVPEKRSVGAALMPETLVFPDFFNPSPLSSGLYTQHGSIAPD